MFNPNTKHKKIDNEALAFSFTGNELLLVNDSIPTFNTLLEYNSNFSYYRYIGKIENQNCFAIQLKDNKISSGSYVKLRKLYGMLPESFMSAAIFSFQVLLWNRRTKFCGACGTQTEESNTTDLMKVCKNCNEEFYPKISPAVIVAIVKDNKLLMARHKKSPSVSFSVLAGFVSPGESLEECINREIKEEAGIEVDNIKYFGSQPWPFPDSLMIAFTADYKSGELVPDEDEILELKWFTPEDIPNWSNKVSIDRALIDDFIERYKDLSF